MKHVVKGLILDLSSERHSVAIATLRLLSALVKSSPIVAREIIQDLNMNFKVCYGSVVAATLLVHSDDMSHPKVAQKLAARRSKDEQGQEHDVEKGTKHLALLVLLFAVVP